MRQLKIISIGAGDPDHVTMQAVRALNQVDVFFIIDKGADGADLLHVRQEVLKRHLEPGRAPRTVELTDPNRALTGRAYTADIADWHRRRTDLLEALIETELPDGACGGLLVWGDPGVYDSTIRIIDTVRERGGVELAVEIIPGVGAPTVLAARHGITLNQVGGAIHITTGRRLREGVPDGVDDLVVMLDGQCSFTTLDPSGWHIYWGAYLGTPDELLIAGPLADKADEIVRLRAAERARKGWMFDTYLLRRLRHPM